MTDNNKNKMPSKEVELLQKKIDTLYREIENLKKSPAAAFFESAQQWRTIFDAIPEPIFLLDKDLKIIRCNASMAEVLNRPYQEIIWQKLDDFNINIDLAGIVRRHISKIKKAPVRSIEIISIDRNWYEITIQPVFNGTEQSFKILVILRNITYLKETEENLTESHTKLKKAFHGTVDALAETIEKRDPFTAGHERRVAQIAQAIAINLGMESEKVEGILISGLLHDLGKIVIPAEILSKPGKLNLHEYNLVKSHPGAGYEILKKVEFPWPVAEIVLQHHERLDGSGYPHGITKEKIIFEARILAVADVFEAMLSHKPYRKAKTLNQVISEIQQHKAILFDEKVVDACTELFQKKNFHIE